MSSNHCIVSVLRNDPLRWRLLGLAAQLNLPDCWIGAGFVRNAVWDHLHDRAPSPPSGDVDVIWFDAHRLNPELDRALETQLLEQEPSIQWSVKNQARMHTRNGDTPYLSAVDAMRHWPETATAVAARRVGPRDCEVACPLGSDDLLELRLRPTPRFIGEKRAIFNQRVEAKRWLSTWPKLVLSQ